MEAWTKWLGYFTLPPATYKGSDSLTHLPIVDISSFFFIATLVDVKWYFIIVLICISLLVNDIQHLFICFLAISLTLEKCLFKSFPIFFFGLFFCCCWVSHYLWNLLFLGFPPYHSTKSLVSRPPVTSHSVKSSDPFQFSILLSSQQLLRKGHFFLEMLSSLGFPDTIISLLFSATVAGSSSSS